MGEVYEGSVAWVADPNHPNGGYYVAMPDDHGWEDRGPEEMHLNDPHPHASLDEDYFKTAARVVWVPDESTLETVELEEQTVPARYHPSGREYTFERRTTQRGGGHFEFAEG